MKIEVQIYQNFLCQNFLENNQFFSNSDWKSLWAFGIARIIPPLKFRISTWFLYVLQMINLSSVSCNIYYTPLCPFLHFIFKCWPKKAQNKKGILEKNDDHPYCQYDIWLRFQKSTKKALTNILKKCRAVYMKGYKTLLGSFFGKCAFVSYRTSFKSVLYQKNTSLHKLKIRLTQQPMLLFKLLLSNFWTTLALLFV